MKYFPSGWSSLSCGATGKCLLTWGSFLSLVTFRRQESAEAAKTKRSQQRPFYRLCCHEQDIASVPKKQSQQVDLVKPAQKIMRPGKGKGLGAACREDGENCWLDSLLGWKDKSKRKA